MTKIGFAVFADPATPPRHLRRFFSRGDRDRVEEGIATSETVTPESKAGLPLM